MKLLSPLDGETPLPCAPKVQIGPGISCIPQHYLVYQHSLESVQQVLLDIEYHDTFPVFVDKQDEHLFIQVGIIGQDNYQQALQDSKIVYGRRWRVEPQLPTSEVIQTVFLALKTAREHEVRERFKLKINNSFVTPMSNHQDLPLLAKQPELVNCRSPKRQVKDRPYVGKDNVQSWLDGIVYDNAKIVLVNCHSYRTGLWLIDFKFGHSHQPNQSSVLPEIQQAVSQESIETLMLNQLSQNVLYMALMSKFVEMSNQHVAENFTYQSFARFSSRLNVVKLGELSKQTRDGALYGEGFSQTLKDYNYETDMTRVPNLRPGPLANRIYQQLRALNVKQGILPSQDRI